MDNEKTPKPILNAASAFEIVEDGRAMVEDFKILHEKCIIPLYHV